MSETYTVMMPRSLTAENGAKALLIGEFKESIELACPECADSCDGEVFEDCEICGGDGTYSQNVDGSWTTIKEI